MRRSLEDYRPDSAPSAARPAPDEKPRANFLGTQQEAALNRRMLGGLFASAVLIGASLFLVS